MSQIDIKKLLKASKDGKLKIQNPEDLVITLPGDRMGTSIFASGPYQDINTKTSRVLGTYRSAPARLLRPLSYAVRGGPKGGVTSTGVYPIGEEIMIMGWPGVSDPKNCDLIALVGSEELPKDETFNEVLEQRLIQHKKGVYINLQEGYDYEYTDSMLDATKTVRSVMTSRNIEYMDLYGTTDELPAFTTVNLVTQFGETFLELDGNLILENPTEDDYI